VLDTAIARIDDAVIDGAEVDLLTDKGQWMARGIFNGRSRIRVRLYGWQPDQPLDDAFWRMRLQRAIRLRQQLGNVEIDTGAARLVYSEADELSGLIVDRFGPHLVVQVNALGMVQRLPQINGILRELLEPRSITVRTEPATQRKEGIEGPVGCEWGEPPESIVFIEEHGIRFGVELSTGHKTGFYLDQRENRRHVAKYVRQRHVLDVCCYSGGFALSTAILGGAAHVLGIDISEHAITLARANAERNGATHAQFQVGDMFTSLEHLAAAGQRFGAVILDPPKFVRGKSGVNQALRAYHRLNRLAVDLLEPEGILVTCSCSGNVARDQFAEMLFGVASKTHRTLQILESHGAAPDHPVSINCPASSYLKCFICRVLT